MLGEYYVAQNRWLRCLLNGYLFLDGSLSHFLYKTTASAVVLISNPNFSTTVSRNPPKAIPRSLWR